MPMNELFEIVNDCEACSLATGRTNVVIGKGNPEAEVLIIGEAPGAEEDLAGLPFVGRAGKLLDEALEYSGATLDDVYICNTVKCRPPDNRPPNEEELYACRGFLNTQIWIVQPSKIITLGRIATFELLNPAPTVRKKPFKNLISQRPFTKSWGRIYPAYHPSYILRSPSHKDDWLDSIADIFKAEL